MARLRADNAGPKPPVKVVRPGVGRPAPAHRNQSASSKPDLAKAKGERYHGPHNPLVVQFDAKFKKARGHSLRQYSNMPKALLDSGVASAAEIRSVLDARAAGPDKRNPDPRLQAEALKLRIAEGARRQTPKPKHKDDGFLGLRFDVGDAADSWKRLLGGSGSENQNASSRDSRSPEQRQADMLNNMSPAMRAAFLRDQQRVADQGGSTEDPFAEAVLGGAVGGIGALGAKALAAKAAARGAGGLLGADAVKSAPAAIRYTTPTKGALSHVVKNRPSIARPLADIAARGPAQRIAAGSGILAAAPAAEHLAGLGAAAGEKIKGGAAKIEVDPSELSLDAQAIAAGETPPKPKDLKGLVHGPGRLGLSPSIRRRLLHQARVNGWPVPDSVNDTELVAKAYKRNATIAQRLTAGLVENASNLAFAPAFAGAVYDATKRSIAGEGAQPFVDIASGMANATANAAQNPIDNPLFAAGIYKGGINAVGKGSAKVLRVKEAPLRFHHGEVKGEPYVHQYGLAAPNTLTRPAALLGQRLLNSPHAGGVRNAIMAKQAGREGETITTRARAAGSIATRDLSKALSKLGKKEQVLAVWSHLTGSSAKNQAADYRSKYESALKRKTGYTNSKGKQIQPRKVDEVNLRALKAKAKEWEQLAVLEANLSPSTQAKIKAFGDEAAKVEEVNQGIMGEFGLSPDTMKDRLWLQALNQHPHLKSLSKELGRDRRSAIASAQKNLTVAESASQQVEAPIVKREAPTDPVLEQVAAEARANADPKDKYVGDWFITPSGELGVVTLPLFGASARKGASSKSLLKAKIVDASGSLVETRLTGRELAAGKARYRAKTSLPLQARVGKGEQRDVTFAKGDNADTQSVTVYPLATTGKIRIGVAKVAENAGSKGGGEGSRYGFFERWRVILGNNQAVPKSFASREDAFLFGKSLDAALARGESPRDALLSAENHSSPTSHADAAAAAVEAARLRVEEERSRPGGRERALAILQSELEAAGVDPRMWVPHTPLDAGPASFVNPGNPFLTQGADRMGGRMKQNTGTTLRTGQIDERPSLAISAAAKPTQIKSMTDDVEQFLHENAARMDVSKDRGERVDSREFVYIKSTKDGKLNRAAIMKRAGDQARLLEDRGLGDSSTVDDLMGLIFDPVQPRALPNGDVVLDKGTYWAMPRAKYEAWMENARTEARRRDLAPGLHRVARASTGLMINTLPRTNLNNLGGVAMSTLGGAGPLAHGRYFKQQYRDLVPPELVGRGISGSQTRAIAGKEGTNVLRPARWWTNRMRTNNVLIEDFARGTLAINDLLKAAKQVQYGGRIKAAMHRVNADTIAIAGNLRETHPAEYKKAVQHTVDFVGDMGHLSKYDPGFQIAIPFWRWSAHILKATLSTMPRKYPLRATLLQAMGEVGREYQREHGIWPSWLQGALDLGDDIPILGGVKGKVNATLPTSGWWPYATQSQWIAPAFDDAGIDAAAPMSNVSPVISMIPALAGKDLEKFDSIRDANYKPIEFGSDEWKRMILARALQFAPTPYSRSGQTNTSLPWDPEYKDNGLPRRGNDWLGLGMRAFGLGTTPVVTGGPDLTKQGVKAFKRAKTSFSKMPLDVKREMSNAWKQNDDGSYSTIIDLGHGH